jgi:hypothetical protein
MNSFGQKAADNSQTAGMMNILGQMLQRVGVDFSVKDTDEYPLISHRFDMPYFSIETTQLFTNEILDLRQSEIYEMWADNPFPTKGLGAIDIGISAQSTVMVYLRLVFPNSFFGEDAGVTSIMFETQKWINDEFLPEWSEDYPTAECGLYMGRPFVAEAFESRYETGQEIGIYTINILQAFAILIFMLFGALREDSDGRWTTSPVEPNDGSVDSFAQMLDGLVPQLEQLASEDNQFQDLAESLGGLTEFMHKPAKEKEEIAQEISKNLQ